MVAAGSPTSLSTALLDCRLCQQTEGSRNNHSSRLAHSRPSVCICQMTKQMKLGTSLEACGPSCKDPGCVCGWAPRLPGSRDVRPRKAPALPCRAPGLSPAGSCAGPSLRAVLQVPPHLYPQPLWSPARISGEHKGLLGPSQYDSRPLPSVSPGRGWPCSLSFLGGCGYAV